MKLSENSVDFFGCTLHILGWTIKTTDFYFHILDSLPVDEETNA